MNPATATAFQLPIWFDLGATFAFALTGALAAIKRGYDVVGLLSIAIVSGIGGGLIRDGIFLQQGVTPLLSDPRYLYVIGGAALLGLLLGERVNRFHRLIALVDALGLGAYACFGVQKSLLAGLGPTAAVFVGVVNAVGGGILRDLLTREEPLVFKPGQFYVLVALAGAVTFVVLTVQTALHAMAAALIAIALTFVFRVLTIAFNWRTGAVSAVKILPESR
ncbi:MAG TPA: TRIC cation channel family protein [Opitutaceae bacterium]|nr:TRIC cation channel family protein [Opitutaceae bacterium]